MLRISLILFCAFSLRAATLAEIQKACDDWLKANEPTIAAAQTEYLKGGRTYWQALPSLKEPPSHTEAAVDAKLPDNKSAKPADVRKGWSEVLPGISSPPAAVSVHEYVGPQGKGWVLVMEFRFKDVLYVRRVNHGPEVHNEQVWVEVKPLVNLMK